MKRPWWLVIAGAIALLEFVLAFGIWIERLTEDRTRELGSGVTVTVPSEFGPLYGDILLTGAVALAGIALVAGISLWSRNPDRAKTLLTLGLVPGVLAGMVFFWFPPFWVVSVVSVILLIALGRDRVLEPA